MKGIFWLQNLDSGWVERVSWKGDPDAICEVFWDLISFRLKAQCEEDFRYPDFVDINLKHSEVIGNMFQNKGLMKRKSAINYKP